MHGLVRRPFEKTDSEVMEIRPDEAVYVISHYDANIIGSALYEYKRLLVKRQDNNTRMDFGEKIEDTEYLFDLFTEIVGHRR